MATSMSSGFIRLVSGSVKTARAAGQTPTSDEADDHIVRSEN